MYSLTIDAATSYVRGVLDELITVDDIGMLASPDGVDINSLVERFILEAVIRTHNKAPILFLEGKQGALDTDYSATMATNTEKEPKVVDIAMLVPTLRVLSIKASDSSIVVTELIPEDSAEGRKQLNGYIRGEYDDPRVVLKKVWGSSGDHLPIMKYYSSSTETLPDFTLEYIPYPEIESNAVSIAPRLEYAVLNELAALVLDALGEHDKSAICKTKVESYLTI